MNPILSTTRVFTSGPIPAVAGYVRLSFGRVWSGDVQAHMRSEYIHSAQFNTKNDNGNEIFIT